jgi:hypothetical protein
VSFGKNIFTSREPAVIVTAGITADKYHRVKSLLTRRIGGSNRCHYRLKSIVKHTSSARTMFVQSRFRILA